MVGLDDLGMGGVLLRGLIGCAPRALMRDREGVKRPSLGSNLIGWGPAGWGDGCAMGLEAVIGLHGRELWE